MKGYQIDITLPLEENVKTILASIVQQLGLPDAFRQDASAAIHDTRKTIKRIRALLKMIREGTGYSFYLRENRFFRDISRRISQARDDYVLLETLQFVASKTRRQAAETTEVLQETITMAMNEEMDALSAPGGAFDTVPTALNEALTRIDATMHLNNDFSSVKMGLRRTYRKGRRLLSLLNKDPSMRNTHEFRKCCRYLQFQMELMAPLYPALLNSYAASIDTITEKLGHIRDLQRLQLFLQEKENEGIPGVSEYPLKKTIQNQSSRAYRHVFALAPLIYAEKPLPFAERFQRYWNTRTHLNK